MSNQLNDIFGVLLEIRDELKQNNTLLQEIINEQISKVIINENLEEMINIRKEIGKSKTDTYPLEGELFERLTGIYIEEEIEKIRANKSKKSSRRVSINLYNSLKEFFENHLSIHNVTIEREKEGILVFYKDKKAVAVIKYMTDLGFIRSEEFFKIVNNFISLSEEKYKVEPENVYFIISTLKNGIQKGYVEKLIQHQIPSNDDFLNNRQWVEKFINEYKSRAVELPNPMKQIQILTAELHPNIESYKLIEDDHYKEIFVETLKNYKWLSNLEEIVESLNNILANTL